MYSHQDKDRFATRIVLIVAVPFTILTAIAIVEAIQVAF